MTRRLRQVRFRLSINDSSPLPPGQDTPLLAEFELTGVGAVKAKHNDTDKISIHFRCASRACAVMLVVPLPEGIRPSALVSGYLLITLAGLTRHRLKTCSRCVTTQSSCRVQGRHQRVAEC